MVQKQVHYKMLEVLNLSTFFDGLLNRLCTYLFTNQLRIIMRLTIILLLFSISICCQAQQTLLVKVAGEESKPLISASILIKGTNKGYSTNALGIASISFLDNTIYILIVSAVGYEEKEIKVTIPYTLDTLKIEMEAAKEEELEEE